MGVRRLGVLAVVLLVALLCAPGARASTVTSDFNHDGFDDVAIAAPNEDVDDIINAGAVHVIYGSATGLSPTATVPDQVWHRNVEGVPGKARQSASFGSSLVVGAFDDDDFDDLAIGAFGDTIGGNQVAGSVTVLYGSANGLTAQRAKTFHQDSKGVKDRVEEADGFGSALAAGDVNDDGIDDLAVGVPNESLARQFQGAVNILFGTARGLSGTAGVGKRFLHQDVEGVEEEGSSQDRFGSALVIADLNDDLVDDLAVGAPGERVGDASGIGLVHVLYSTSNGIEPTLQPFDELIQQGTNDYEGTMNVNDAFGRVLATGDFNGDDVADLAIGTNDDVGASAFNAGALAVVYGAPTAGVDADNGPGDQLITQDSTDMPDAAAINEDFTASLAVGDFNNDGVDDIAVGNPDDLVSGQSGAGTTTVIYGDNPDGLSGSNTPGAILLSQDGVNVDDASEQVDRFGGSVTSGDYDQDGSDDIVVGIPGEDLAAGADVGALHAFYGDPTLGISPVNTPPDQFLSQDTANIEEVAEPFDTLGVAAATSAR